VADTTKVAREVVTLVVQVNGKVRDKLEVAPDISEADAEAAALASPKVQAFLDGAEPSKVIVRVPKLVNIVV
jgi:leucyl-tRNA synthetase